MATGLVVLALAGSAAAQPQRRFTTATLSRAYERWLFHRYPGPSGHWVCPVGDKYATTRNGDIYCWAEFYGPTSWHSLTTIARVRGRHVRFVAQPAHTVTWTRRWRPLPGRLLSTSGAHATINASIRVHDWYWLSQFADGVAHRKAKRATFVASDGPIAYEFEIFERFTCVRSPALVTCTTPLGDAMRYRP